MTTIRFVKMVHNPEEQTAFETAASWVEKFTQQEEQVCATRAVITPQATVCPMTGG